MRYFIAIFLPPLAVFLCGGRIVDTVINLVLTLMLWVPGVLHAWLVINSHKGEVRMRRMEKRLLKAQKNAR